MTRTLMSNKTVVTFESDDTGDVRLDVSLSQAEEKWLHDFLDGFEQHPTDASLYRFAFKDGSKGVWVDPAWQGLAFEHVVGRSLEALVRK